MARRRPTPPPAPATPVAPRQGPATAPGSESAGRPPESERVGPPAGSQPRRRFVIRLWTLLGGVALAEVAWITGSFLRPRKRDATSANLFVAGPAERFERGSVTAFPAGMFYLVRLKEGGFMALHRECTHLGCTVPWNAAQGRFACPCHASAFDITGQVVSPPAPRPLDFYAIRIENGVVKVDTRQRLQRTAFDPSQVTVS